MSGIGIFFAVKPKDGDMSEAIATMDKITRDWEMRAARGECEWICASCCMGFVEGMPDECCHGHQSCTDIIKRDKAEAMSASKEGA